MATPLNIALAILLEGLWVWLDEGLGEGICCRGLIDDGVASEE